MKTTAGHGSNKRTAAAGTSVGSAAEVLHEVASRSAGWRPAIDVGRIDVVPGGTQRRDEATRSTSLPHAIRAHQVLRPEKASKLGNEFGAAETLRALAIACIRIGPITTARTIDGVMGRPLRALRRHRDLDEIRGLVGIPTRDHATLLRIRDSVDLVCVAELAIRASHSPLEAVHQAKATLALERPALDIDFSQSETAEVDSKLVLRNAGVANSPNVAANSHGEQQQQTKPTDREQGSLSDLHRRHPGWPDRKFARIRELSGAEIAEPRVRRRSMVHPTPLFLPLVSLIRHWSH